MKNKLLIIDDEPDILITMKMSLELEGFEVRTSRSGADALKKLGEEKPDILLLDLMLPDKSGFQLANEIKSKEEYKDIPIIVLSGMTDEASKHIAAKGGVVEFIEKPVDMPKLLFHIRDILGTI